LCAIPPLHTNANPVDGKNLDFPKTYELSLILFTGNKIKLFEKVVSSEELHKSAEKLTNLFEPLIK